MHLAQPSLAGRNCETAGGRKQTVWLCVLLALMTAAVYWPVLELGFTNFDDPAYVTANPRVQAGLTGDSVKWAFTRAHAANWHPLTWVSHMLDCELYGQKPAGHHLTNLLFHIADSLLLFGLLQRLTGALWRSAFVAALFALHPLHVESVAWVAERKDVLSAFFFLLTLWCYARYTHAECGSQGSASGDTYPAARNAQHGGTNHLPSAISYVLSLGCFAFGLMSKPMLVTVPFVLLLLDYWPLRRLCFPPLRLAGTPSPHHRATSPLRLFLEKLPFFVLSAASCVVTLEVQRQGGAVVPLAEGLGIPLESRLMNTPMSYVWYLVKLIWPSDLAVIYPSVREWPLVQVLLATVLLLALTSAAVWQGRRRPYVLAGWLWYLGMLVPVIGLVKVGAQFVADRYMYLPSIGLFIMLSWGVADLTASWARCGLPLVVGAMAVLAACALAVGRQLLYWQNTETLFRRALAVTRDNYIAYNSMGFWFAQHGQAELAKRYYRLALNIAPDYLAARNHLGWALVRQNKYADAIVVFESALRLNPAVRRGPQQPGRGAVWPGQDRRGDQASARSNPARPRTRFDTLQPGQRPATKDQPAEAADEFRLAARLNPRYAEAHNNLATVLAKQGKPAEAVAEFKRALAVQPDLLPAHYGLGEVLVDQDRLEEAVAQFREVLRLQPNHQPSWVQMGLAYAKQGMPSEAAEAFAAAVRLKPNDAEAQCHLAAALASQHKTREAVQHYRAALKLAPDLPEALNNLAWILAANPDSQIRNGREAVELAEHACRLTDHQRPLLVGTLAAAYAEAGRFAEAVATAEKAKALAEQSNQASLAVRNGVLLERYRAGQPARDTP